jgi:DNA-binding MarR family transcriptional regulator
MSGADTDRALHEAWAVMADLVLDNDRRQEVSEAVGLPFGRVRALRRIAGSSMTLGELAATLGIDPPNCTALVDDLEVRGLVERRPHASDRRSKVVVATPAGARLAAKARRILETPPARLRALSPGDVVTLADILARVRVPGTPARR